MRGSVNWYDNLADPAARTAWQTGGSTVLSASSSTVSTAAVVLETLVGDAFLKQTAVERMQRALDAALGRCEVASYTINELHNRNKYEFEWRMLTLRV